MSKPVLNSVKERMMFLSPTVQAGWEPESKRDDFEEVKILGQGAFGVVKRVTHKKTGLTYAIKIVEKNMLKKTNMVDQMKNEVQIMYSLNHPYILKLFNHFEDDTNIYLILEFATGGQLYAVLWKQPQKRFNEKLAAKFILQLTLALEHLHKRNIIHRDIKPENILLDDQLNIRLCDFGWSNFLKPDEPRQTFCGTLDYLAPEMLDKNRYHDQTVDIWAVGVLCFELLTGMSPFAPQMNTNNQAFVEKTTKENIVNLKLNFPPGFPEAAKELIIKILVKDPTKRATAEEIRNIAWIKENTADFKLPKQITVELEKKIITHKEIDNLKQEGKAVFSKEQIFEYSRPDSIIVKEYVQNDKQQDGGLLQKLKEKDAIYQKLEFEYQKKLAENEELKCSIDLLKKGANAQNEAYNLQTKLKMQDERNAYMKQQYDQQVQQNLELQRRIRELENDKKEHDILKSKYQKVKDEVAQLRQGRPQQEQQQQQQGATQVDDLLKKLQNKYG